jgi:hypothetical protein
VQPRQALAPVGDGAGRVLEPTLLDGQRALQFRAVGDGVVEGPLSRLQRRLQFGLLLADTRGLALHVLRVTAAPLLSRGRGGALDPGVGQRDRAPHPLGELRELVPGLLSPLQARREAAYLVLQLRLPGQRRLQLRFRGLLALLQCGLVSDLRSERLPQPHEVVGEQSQSRVAQIGLDDGGPPGHCGLPPERLELPPQLVRQILYAGQVGLHCIQLPQRLLFALAVFEDAGRLLDEGPAPHRIGMEHGVELALSDDHMHFAADTGVRQQFLDVEQSAGIAIDLVFAAAVAEHDPRNGDFGIFNGQRTVGVVNGERDLGAAERWPPSCPSEDHVFHFAAAQRLGTLFAHDPGQRVHHIGLAGTIGPHHTRDTRFEPQGRGGGEGLEPAQGQALEVHAVGLYPPLSVSQMNVQGTFDDKTLVVREAWQGRRGPGKPKAGKTEGTPKRPLRISDGRERTRPVFPGQPGEGSGEGRLRLGYVGVDAVQHRRRISVLRGGLQGVVLRLNPYEFGFQVLDTLLEPSHLGKESRVSAADVTEKRLCHDGWSSTLSDRPKRCGS